MDPFPMVILLATDGSEEARIASRMAAGIAEGTDSDLHLVYVAGTGGADPRVYEQMRQSSRALLDEQADKMRDAGAKITKKHLRNGRPDREIVALAEELGAGLIVVGGRGLGGMKRALMGSVSDSVVRHASCPVLVARGGIFKERTSHTCSRASFTSGMHTNFLERRQGEVRRKCFTRTPVNKGQKSSKASIARRKTKTASLSATPTSSLCAYVSPRRGG